MANIDWEASIKRTMAGEKAIRDLGGYIPDKEIKRELSEIEKEIKEFWLQMGPARSEEFKIKCRFSMYPKRKTEITCLLKIIDKKLKTTYNKKAILTWEKHKTDLIDYLEIIEKRITEEINRMKKLINY